MYLVKTEKFEGPLDLLLKFVEEHKLSINEISLAQIADQYLNYINSIEQMPYFEVAEFLAVAATLILIKSKSLLPNLTLSPEEELNVEELQKRLELYKIFKEAAEIIKSRYQKNVLWGREKFLNMEPVFAPSENFTLNNLRQILKTLIESLPEKEILPEKIIKQTISLENKIQEIQSSIERLLKTTFESLNQSKDKTEIILNFLAMLELIKQGFISAIQKSSEEILIEKNMTD